MANEIQVLTISWAYFQKGNFTFMSYEVRCTAEKSMPSWKTHNDAIHFDRRQKWFTTTISLDNLFQWFIPDQTLLYGLKSYDVMMTSFKNFSPSRTLEEFSLIGRTDLVASISEKIASSKFFSGSPCCSVLIASTIMDYITKTKRTTKYENENTKIG